jgi:hypothetical protein
MSSLAFCDDYGGVLCRSHGDGIPSVMTSRVCEKPSTSTVPIRLYIRATSIGAQLSYCFLSLRPILGSAVACKNGYSCFDNVAESRYDLLLTDEVDSSGNLFGRWRRHRL